MLPDLITGVTQVIPVAPEDILVPNTKAYLVMAESSQRTDKVIIAYHETEEGNSDNGEDEMSFTSIVRGIIPEDALFAKESLPTSQLNQLAKWYEEHFPDAFPEMTILGRFLGLQHKDGNVYTQRGIVEIVEEFLDILPQIRTQAQTVFEQ